MDTIKVRQLLEKYYEGHTSEKEENQLKSFFESNVPDEFRTDRDLFMKFKNEEKASNPDFDITETLNNLIDEQNEPKNEKSIRLKTYSSWLYRVAAVFALAVSVYLANEFIFSPDMARNDSIEVQDTYENPELAYLETKKALLYLSAQLNKGTEELKNIQKINQSIEQLTKLSEIDKARKLMIRDEDINEETQK
jgi:hypothetical protein